MMFKVKTFLITICMFCLVFSSQAQLSFKTNNLSIQLTERGEFDSLYGKSSAKEYSPESAESFLFQLKIEGEVIAPLNSEYKKGTISFNFPNDIQAKVAVKEASNYLAFRLKKISNSDKIDAVIWGPVATVISDTIGEFIGVVRDADYAIGIQALNAKTTGGVLENPEGTVYQRGTTAIAQDYGSSLQAFCMNRSKERKVNVRAYHTFADAPVGVNPDASMIGCGIALFGAKPSMAVDVIGEIELGEGLPHPMIDGEWIKKSDQTGRAYMIAGFTESNVDTLIDYAERMGMLSLYHEHPFKNWGHFDLIDEQFPNGLDGMKKCVEKAEKKGIRLGVHTLTTFMTTNDPYITPVPHPNLAIAGGSFLSKNIDENSLDIIVDDPKYFSHKSSLQSIRIGDEIIRYQKVTEEAPYKLIGCIRGAFGTIKASHQKGNVVNKLQDHAYKVFFPDWTLQKEIIANMAEFFNKTGVSHMDFDGHEGAYSTGEGDFSMDYFAEEFQNQIGHTVVNGSSRSNHYYWHVNHYLNWGEPWYGGFRESQSDVRFKTQPLLERNYMPNMLGWFLLTPTTTVEDIDWMMARAAGYNAGYAFVARIEVLKSNPNTDEVVKQVRDWEDAKRAGVFNKEQRERLKNPDNEFHLERLSEKEWELQSFSKFSFEHENLLVQPGQPTYTEWNFENKGKEQAFIIKFLAKGDEGILINPVLELDNFYEIKFPVTLKPGYSMVYDGTGKIRIYNKKGRFVEEVEFKSEIPAISKGNHSFTFDGSFEDAEGMRVMGTIKLKGDSEKVKSIN